MKTGNKIKKITITNSWTVSKHYVTFGSNLLQNSVEDWEYTVAKILNIGVKNEPVNFGEHVTVYVLLLFTLSLHCLKSNFFRLIDHKEKEFLINHKIVCD